VHFVQWRSSITFSFWISAFAAINNNHILSTRKSIIHLVEEWLNLYFAKSLIWATLELNGSFEVDTINRCLVIALLLLIRYVTLWPWPLTFVSGRTWRVTWSTPPPSLKILRLSVLELWVLTSPIGYHWQRVCSKLSIRHITGPMRSGQFFPTYLKSLTPICISLYSFYGAAIKTNVVMRQKSLWSRVKDHMALCACAKSRQPRTLP